jgi:hypothetical protein
VLISSVTIAQQESCLHRCNRAMCYLMAVSFLQLISVQTLSLINLSKCPNKTHIVVVVAMSSLGGL